MAGSQEADLFDLMARDLLVSLGGYGLGSMSPGQVRDVLVQLAVYLDTSKRKQVLDLLGLPDVRLPRPDEQMAEQVVTWSLPDGDVWAMPGRVWRRNRYRSDLDEIEHDALAVLAALRWARGAA